MITIRKEQPADYEQVYELNAAAFGQPLEAEIVVKLRESCTDLISLVADLDGAVVGHILFSPAVIDSGEHQLSGMGLAPMAVSPQHQGVGIGSKLVGAGLKELEELGYPYCIVLGHPGYYPKFGFVKASEYCVSSEYPDIPDEAFMIRVFDEKELEGVSGVARYRPEFNVAI